MDRMRRKNIEKSLKDMINNCYQTDVYTIPYSQMAEHVIIKVKKNLKIDYYDNQLKIS
jgi:hypothetical protein